MNRPKYSIDEQRAIELAAIVVLHDMIEEEGQYPLLLEGVLAELEPVLTWLHGRGYVEIEADERYVPSAKGRRVLDRFMQRYDSFVKTMDVYSAVDLEAGEFAFERFFDFESDEDFEAYLHDERWADLRVAVAEHKRIDPIEVVFMSYLQERRITAEGSEDEGLGLLLGRHWQDIASICNEAIAVEELAFTSDGDTISGVEVLERIILEGVELTQQLKRQELELDDDAEPTESNRVNEPGETTIEETVDSRYVPPIWGGSWWI